MWKIKKNGETLNISKEKKCNFVPDCSEPPLFYTVERMFTKAVGKNVTKTTNKHGTS